MNGSKGGDTTAPQAMRGQRDYFGWIGRFNPVDLLGDQVEICTLSLIWGISSLISTGFDFQSSGFV
jgi:hypothetical protein